MDSPFKLSDVKPQSTSMNSIAESLRQSYNTPIEPTYTKGGFFDTLLKGSDNLTTKYTDKTIQDSHVQLNDGSWTPKYETYSPNRDNAKYYADTQTSGDKWTNGLLKFGGKTLSAIAGGTLGTIIGVKDWVTSGNMSALYDNDFTRNLDDLNVKMDNKLPNYYTESEQNAGFIDSLGTANFWANDFLGGLSFTVGAIGSELLWGAATGGTSLSTLGARLPLKFAAMKTAKTASQSIIKNTAKKTIQEGLVREGIENSMKSLSINLAKAGSLANTTRFALTSAGYESGVEALQFKKEAEDNYYDDFRRKNGRDPNDQDIAEFTNKLDSAANGLFGYNMALVGSSNILMYGKMFDIKNPLTAPSKWVNKKVFGVGLDTTTNTVVKATRTQKNLQKAYNILSPMVTEGIIEEGGQAVGSKTASNWIESSYDPKFTKGSMDLGDAFLDGLDETYTTKEGWKEIGLGALIGALTGGAGTVYNRARGRESESNFATIEREANEMMAFNKDYSPHKMANMLFYANRIQNATQEGEVAETEGNFTMAEKSRRDKSLAQLAYAYNMDYLSETVDDTTVALQSLDVNKLAEERGITLEEAQAEKDQAINDYISTAREYKLNRDFAENFFGDVLRRENLDYTQTATLKDAVAYELTQGTKSWEFSRDLFSAIQGEVKNVIGGDKALSLRDIAKSASPEIKREIETISNEIRQNETKLKETETKRKNVSEIKVSDIEVNRARANTATNLAIELSRLTENKQNLENRLNILLESANLNNPFTTEASPIVSAEDILRLDNTLSNIKTLTENNPRLKNLMEEYERTSRELIRYSELTRQLRNTKLQADGAKGLSKLLLGNGKKINEVTQDFIKGIRGSMELVGEQQIATQLRGVEPVNEAIEVVEGAETVTPTVTVLNPIQQIIQNNKEYFSRKGIETDEQLSEAFPTQEELERFDLLVQKSKYDENFSEYDDVEILESSALTEAEQIELNSLYNKLDAWQMLSTFENDGISIADMFEMQAQNLSVPKPIESQVSTEEFSDLVSEGSSRGSNYRREDLSQTPDGVQFKENKGKYTVHNISLAELVSQIGSNDVLVIEEDGEFQILPSALSSDVGTKVRVNYGDDHIILTVVAGGVIEIENPIVFLNNSNYTPISYSGQNQSSYSPLYYKGGEMVESDFNSDATYNIEAVYNLNKGDVLFFKVDLNDPYNQTLIRQPNEIVEKQLKVFIVDQSGNILGDLKANEGVFGTDGFNLLRKEAMKLFVAGQSGNLSITSSVKSVLLGVPKFTLNEEGLPINKSFSSDNILDWGYWNGSSFNLKNNSVDVRTSMVSKFNRKIPVVVFRVGNQVVAFPVNLRNTQTNDRINLLEIINDQSQSLAKQVIKINQILLDRGYPGDLFYLGDNDQNVFKDVATQEMSEVFNTAQKTLDAVVEAPNLLGLDVNELVENVLSPIDFSNKPLASPRVAFDLSNLGTQSLNQEVIKEVESTGEVIETPNPSKVTQDANKEVEKVVVKQLPTVQNTDLITMKDRGEEVSYSVKPFDSSDTNTIQEIRNILERGDTVFPKGSSGTYEYNGSSLILLRGNGENTISDFSKLGRGLEIYKSKFNSSKIQDKKDVIEADNSLVNRAKKEQNKKC